MTHQSGKATTVKKTFSQVVEVSTEINAKPEVIWALLTNGADYSRWNSTIVSFEGDIVVKGKIILKATIDPKRSFKLTVSQMEEEKQMTWESGAAPFFKGIRTYTLTPRASGMTGFGMVEKMGGLMFPMAAGQLPDFTAPFEQFAADLKKEAELIAN